MRKAGKWLVYALFCIYIYFFYHLIVGPAFAEYSFFGLLVIPLALFAFWLVPKEQRKGAVVFTFLFLLMDYAISSIYDADRPLFYIWVIFIGLFSYPIARWYARIKGSAVVIALAVALLFNVLMPYPVIQALPHLYLKWSSEKLFVGEGITGALPIAAADIDGDGKDEIITLGNRDKYPSGKRKEKLNYVIEDEPLNVYVWKWNKGTMKRIPAKELDPAAVRKALPEEYIGFPYYVLNDDLALEPLVQRQPLTEGMMQFGTAPYRAMLMNMNNIQRLMEKRDYMYDEKQKLGGFKNVVLKNGLLSGSYKGESFEVPSTATKIVGSMKMKNGREGLLVLGLELELLQMVDGKLVVSNVLTRDMQEGLAQCKFIIKDLDHDGAEELIIGFPYSKILEPKEDRSWDIKWITDQKSFRIKDVGSFDPKGPQEIISLSKSLVRANDITYLTSFTYTPNGLQQNWKIFLTYMENVMLADLDGDDHKELVTTIYGGHTVYVWGKHNVPITWILTGITAILLIYLGQRRFYHANKTKTK